MSADGTGLIVQSSTVVTGGPDSVGSLAYEQGNLYEQTGYVRDAGTGAVLGHFQLPAYLGAGGTTADQIVAVTPDLANSRAFVLLHDVHSSHLLLLNYSTSTYSLQSVMDLGYDNFDTAITTHMLFWGSNGVAFNRDGLQILSGTFIATPTASSTVRAVAHRRLGELRVMRAYPPLGPISEAVSNGYKVL